VSRIDSGSRAGESKRTARSIVSFLLVTALTSVALGVVAPAASADANDVPSVSLAGVNCSRDDYGRGVIKANTPGRPNVKTFYADFENIYWQAELWREYANGWSIYRQSRWLLAVGTYQGLVSGVHGGWRDYWGDNTFYLAWSFNALPPGRYAVKEKVEWTFSTDLQYSGWVPMNGTAYVICDV
jgi:hypothetical protein